MMQALASYVMRGRLQAIIAAVLATLLFNVIGAAIVALVILRRGFNQGVPVLLAALVPATFAAIQLGEIITLPMIVLTALGAQLLRALTSWRTVLLVFPVVSSLMALALYQFGETRLDVLAQLYSDFVQTVAQQQPEGTVLPFPLQVSNPQIASGFAMLVCFSAIVSLLLARSMQAGLYNPGGFRQEFHALRFAPQEALGLLGVCVLLLFTTGSWQLLGLVFAQPLFFAGVALVHGYVGLRKFPSHLLVLFYMLVLMMGLFRVGLILLAALDSLVDFRKRAAAKLANLQDEDPPEDK